MYINGDSRAVLEDIRIEPLDAVWPDAIRRVSATARPDVDGGVEASLEGYRLAIPTVIMLTYEFSRCPVPMQGLTYIDRAEVAYRLFGRTHRDDVEIVPIVLTECRLARLPGC